MVKIDTEQNKIVSWIQLPVTEKFDNEGKAAHGLCASPDGKSVYLTSQFTDKVYVIDAESNEIVNTIQAGKNPNWIDITPDGKIAVVSNTSSNDADIIDLSLGKSIAKIAVGKNPKRLDVSMVRD
ncbi:hypothetical protein [uncultured Algoriphagus sp.]|uniref:YncE family protein n=1 Tax=uncultured Algoriphagus sp. TaxID=417365 RepID=UPI0030EE5FAE